MKRTDTAMALQKCLTFGSPLYLQDRRSTIHFTSLICVRLVRRFTNSVRFLSVVASYVLTRTRKVEKQLSNCGGSHIASASLSCEIHHLFLLCYTYHCAGYRTATPTINVGLEPIRVPSGSRAIPTILRHTLRH